MPVYEYPALSTGDLSNTVHVWKSPPLPPGKRLTGFFIDATVDITVGQAQAFLVYGNGRRQYLHSIVRASSVGYIPDLLFETIATKVHWEYGGNGYSIFYDDISYIEIRMSIANGAFAASPAKISVTLEERI